MRRTPRSCRSSCCSRQRQLILHGEFGSFGSFLGLDSLESGTLTAWFYGPSRRVGPGSLDPGRQLGLPEEL